MVGENIRYRDKPGDGLGRLACVCSLVALGACSSSQRIDIPPSPARINSFAVSPLPSRPIARGVGVHMDTDYTILDPDFRAGTYSAVAELRGAEHSVAYLQDCGRGSRYRISEPSGRLSLRCDMRVPVRGDGDNLVHLRIRLYQRTGREVSTMIASSQPVTYTVRDHDLMHRAMARMARCDDATRDGKAVRVCRE